MERLRVTSQFWIFHHRVDRRLYKMCLIQKHLQGDCLWLHIYIKAIDPWPQMHRPLFTNFLVHFLTTKNACHYFIIAFMLFLFMNITEKAFKRLPNQRKLVRRAMVAINYKYNNILCLIHSLILWMLRQRVNIMIRYRFHRKPLLFEI